MDSESNDMGRGGEVVQLPHNVYRFAGVLSLDEQHAVLYACERLSRASWNRRLRSDHRKLRTRAEAKEARAAITVLYHNWSSYPLSMGRTHPSASLLESVAANICAHCDGVPFTPTAMYSIAYPPGGRFGLHVDGADGWVLAITIGCACVFKYGPSPDELTSVRVESGDALLFKGGELFHGVDHILSGTAPPFFSDFKLTKGVERLNIQFRDSTSDAKAGRYIPKFVHYNKAQWSDAQCPGCSGCVVCAKKHASHNPIQ